MGKLKKSDYKANMKAIFRRKLHKYQNKTNLKLRNISNRFSMRQRILLSDRFIGEATGYHVVWIPKCLRKVLYGQLRQYLGQVLREFRRKGIPTFNLLETTCTVNKGHRYIF